MIEKVFVTSDSRRHNTYRAASKHEALIGIDKMLESWRGTCALGYLSQGVVRDKLISNLPEIQAAVQRYEMAHLTPDYDESEVRDWVAARLLGETEFVTRDQVALVTESILECLRNASYDADDLGVVIEGYEYFSR